MTSGDRADTSRTHVPVDSNDQTRRRNLSAMVTIIHRDGPTSRAGLTRRTGLNRATVGTLVTELESAGIVVERTGRSRGRVGRPSTVVEPAQEIAALAVNPETTGISFALVRFGSGIAATSRLETEESPTPERALAATQAAMTELVPPGTRLLGIGVAVPGVVRMEDGHVRVAPHLGWNDVALAELLRAATGLPVHVANDAMAGALGESAFGLGRGVSDLVYLNGVSGIGGGIIVDGVPLAGNTGAAGEFGHTVIDIRGVRCHCGRRGCLETIVSLSRLSEIAGRPPTLDGLDEMLAQTRDPRVLAELDIQVEALAIGIANIMNAVDPAVVALGGYLGCLLEWAGDRLVSAAHEGIIAAESRTVTIVRGTATPSVVMVGAAELAFDAFLDDPLEVAALRP